MHTVERGLYDRPTNLNNVETWANVPLIINRGAAWFASIGTAGSKGTKIFSLVGKINNTGLVEVPMGIPLREIIYDIGGGIPGGKKFKAVQTGGPSGGCIPESLLDLPGGLRRADQGRLHDGLRRHDRHGRGHLHGGRGPLLPQLPQGGVLRQVRALPRRGPADAGRSWSASTAGQGRWRTWTPCEELGDYLVDTALCALGSTAANPVLTTLRYFRHEYEAHISERYCPAGVCKPLFQLRDQRRDLHGLPGRARSAARWGRSPARRRRPT